MRWKGGLSVFFVARFCVPVGDGKGQKGGEGEHNHGVRWAHPERAKQSHRQL
jgi:hypothetical protein